MPDSQSPVLDTRGQFLIAMPGLEDPLFAGSLIYILDHTDEGATGLIVNRPMDVSEDEVLEQFDKDHPHAHGNHPIYQGGPVDTQRGFVLHAPGDTQWGHEIPLTDNLHCTMSADILEAIAGGKNIGEHLVILGYAGWDAGQLEQEIADNAWLIAPATESILLETRFEHRLDAVMAQLGIDYHSLSPMAGHA
ncbi:Uncharacterised protein [BD1-7 clade bacterium]|uniref:UPF0301 protein OPDIPICF_01774 n=1 Tax=BD1-7 clade bacterium TaxID=2029982 RepID=A0A5S9QC02_9GAMM|nr:Uncharacterised protein [BD1-7 clade bacterium]